MSLARKLYDQLVSPIHLYGSEIWMAYTCPRAIMNGITQTLVKSQNTLSADKTRLTYMKYSLRMHRTAPSCAIIGEMGLFPLYINAIPGAALALANSAIGPRKS